MLAILNCLGQLMNGFRCEIGPQGIGRGSTVEFAIRFQRMCIVQVFTIAILRARVVGVFVNTWVGSCRLPRWCCDDIQISATSQPLLLANAVNLVVHVHDVK